MKKDKDDIDIALVSDVRYPNEGEWVHSWGGYLVHVEAYRIGRRVEGFGVDENDDKPARHYFEAPNEQERINDPIVSNQSDYHVDWRSRGLTLEEARNHPKLQAEVLRALNSCSWFDTLTLLREARREPSR